MRVKMTYDDMIKLLKDEQHSAPDSWAEIEAELEFTEVLSELPSYSAPDMIWDNIEEALPENKPSIEAVPYKKYLWISGFIILLLSLFIMQLLTDKEEKSEYQYRSELVQLDDNNIAPVMIDKEIGRLMHIIEENKYYLNEEKLNSYKEQLAQITESLDQLIELQEKYGSTEEGTKLMARMERGKADLLKSIISEL